jgi:hypothetical protein
MTPQAIAETYATEVLSGFDFYKPDFLEKLFRRYGDQGMSFFQTLRMMGFETATGRDTYGHFEENRTHELAWLNFDDGGNVIPGDETITTIRLGTNSLDGSDNYYPRPGNMLLFNDGSIATISAVTEVGAGDVDLVLYPNVMAEPVPDTGGVNTPVIIFSNNWAEGTEQPVGALKGTFKYENDAQIIKETISVTGTEMVNQTWFTKYGDDGKSIVGYWTVALMDIDYRMNLAIDGALLFSKRTDNQALIPSSSTYGTKTTEGLFPYIERVGKVETIAEGAFGINDFDNIDRYLDQQGVSKYSLVMPGINRHQEMENALKAYFQDTNIVYAQDVVNSDIFKSNESLGATVNFKYLTKSERIFMFKRFNNLNNPKTYGVSNAESTGGYEQPNYAVFLPVGSTKDASSRKLVNNIGCRFRSLGNYSRRMEVFQIGGAGPQSLKVSDIDELNTHQRAHIGFHGASGNQMVWVRP